MGKPATTYFCDNGHLLEHNHHHCYGEYDLRMEYNMYRLYEEVVPPPKQDPPCPICGNENVHMTLEWGSDGYLQEVPTDPIRVEEGVAVFDISALLDIEKRKALIEGHMKKQFSSRVQ